MGQGVYVIPIHDKLFGEVLPSMEEITALLADKEHVKIMPTSQYGLNDIGLTFQASMKMFFLTNGTKKNITIGKSSIVFHQTTTKKLAMVGSISSLLFLGLEELDLNRLTESELEKNHRPIKKGRSKQFKA